jgi:Ca-activated chloride channel family protein
MPGDLRRRAVVLLSDGEDTSSLVTLDTLLDAAVRAQTTIYAIGLRASERGEVVLGQLTSQTGGRYFPSRRASDLRRSFAQIGQELASQYLLGYVSANQARNNDWREVVVRVGRPNLEVRTRPGYRAGTMARPGSTRKN